MGLRLAHQLRIGVGEIDLPVRRRQVIGWLGRPTAAPLLVLPSRLLGFVLRAFGRGLRGRFSLQPSAGGVELVFQRLPSGDLGRQRLWVESLGIGRLGLGAQSGDVGGKLLAQRLRPVVAQ
jgi:hypothetical protein